MLDAGVEFSRIVNDEDDVGPVDEPLDNIVERVRAVHLLAHFQNAGNFYNIGLPIFQSVFFIFKTSVVQRVGKWRSNVPLSTFWRIGLGSRLPRSRSMKAWPNFCRPEKVQSAAIWVPSSTSSCSPAMRIWKKVAEGSAPDARNSECGNRDLLRFTKHSCISNECMLVCNCSSIEFQWTYRRILICECYFFLLWYWAKLMEGSLKQASNQASIHPSQFILKFDCFCIMKGKIDWRILSH